MKKNRSKYDALLIAHRKFLYKYRRRSKQVLIRIIFDKIWNFSSRILFLWEQAMLWIRNNPDPGPIFRSLRIRIIA